jgi:hypothetical protein
MKKLLLFIASLGLLTTATNLGSNANAHYGNSTSPHVDSKFEFPHNRWATVRQSIQIHVPQSSQPLEQVSIDVPENVDFQTSKVEITAVSQIISTSIFRQGQRLQLKFNQPITPSTILRINFNNVTRNMRTQSSVYSIYGKTVDGLNSYLGEAYFPQ